VIHQLRLEQTFENVKRSGHLNVNISRNPLLPSEHMSAILYFKKMLNLKKKWFSTEEFEPTIISYFGVDLSKVLVADL
jgi:hypothetical protein